MKIGRIETFLVDAGWRCWVFVKVETDDGLVGWGECSDGRLPHALIGAVKDFEAALLGEDPRQVERLYWKMYRISRQHLGGSAHRATAGIELALWDIKARALGISVSELHGGPVRERQQIYWSHCGTVRAHDWELVVKPPLLTYADITALGKEAVARGFTALKTNIVIPGEHASVYSPGFSPNSDNPDGVVTAQTLNQIDTLIGTFREAVGPDIGIALDINYNFKTDGVQRIAKLLEPYRMQWVECDTWDPIALRQIKDSTSTPIASLESLITSKQYRPYLEQHAVNTCIIDLPWNGWIQGKRVADMAESVEINVAPHNHYSHLADCIAAQFCGTLPNVKIMEIEIDDVPWKKDLVTVPPTIEAGYIHVPSGPGWGTALNEEALRAHPWPKAK